jgi:hypothetical protein
MVRCPTNNAEYLIQDTAGYLYKLDTKKRTTERLLSFHSGPVAATDASPLAHAFASLGADGTLRIYNHLTRMLLMGTKYPSGGASLAYLPDVSRILQI